MAAPTPVRALVHSSTLVTAGVWLVIRFRQSFHGVITISVFFGLLTLFIASCAALIERDAKKVVALSTLRQLGLIFLALGIGRVFVCLFHLLIHALAKANLFLVVGNLIHSRFSEQDLRFMSVGNTDIRSIIIILTRILSLRGVFFMRGFFSKEIILVTRYNLINRTIVFLLTMRIISLTISYCVKIGVLLLYKRIVSLVVESSPRFAAIIPRVILRRLSFTIG